jgi:hypothetical protein
MACNALGSQKNNDISLVLRPLSKNYKFVCSPICFCFQSWPTLQGLKPKDYLNKGGRVTVFGLKPNTPLLCAVEQLANYLENLNVKIVIKVDNHLEDDVTSAFEKTSIKERVR